MKLMVYIYFTLFHFDLTTGRELDNETAYVSLIKWTRGYYSASAVFFLFPNKEDKQFDGLKTMQISYMWSRFLGREQIATLSSSFSNVQAVTKNYNNLRPLIIVIIPGTEAIFDFSRSTKSLRMSSFAWFVIFLPTALNGEQSFCHTPSGNLFNLSFDTEMLVMCHGDPVLREWYSVDGNSTETFDLIEWHPDRQLVGSSAAPFRVLTNLSLYERRNDLRGKVLRAVIVKDSLLISVNEQKWKGYFSIVITELENALNFTLDIVAMESEYGSFDMTRKLWSGALRWVAAEEVDIGIADFSMTNNRLDYVDYTVPIVSSRFCLCMKQPEIFAVKWFAYYKTFSFALWMSIFMMLIVSQFVLSFIRSRIESCSMIEVMAEEIFRTCSIICQQGVGEFPQCTPLRLAYFSILVTCIVISAAYSASLICFVTARIRDLPFNSIDELIKDGLYSIIVVKGSSDYDMFLLANDSLSRSMRKVLKPPETLPHNIQSAFHSICSDYRLALYTSYSADLQKRTIGFRIPCQITCLDIGRVDSLSLILPKKSQYTSILNYYLQKLLNTGVLNRFKNGINSAEETRFQPVGFSSVASVLIIFSCGAALALVILIVEVYCDRHQIFIEIDRPYD